VDNDINFCIYTVIDLNESTLNWATIGS